MDIEMNNLPLQFHLNIQCGNPEGINNFIESYPEEKLVSVNGNSAIAFALKCECFDVYETLVSNGFKLAPNESFNEILNFIEANPFSNRDKKKIAVWLRETHKKYVIDSSLTHLYKLILKAKLTHSTDDANRRQFDELIAGAFEELNQIRELVSMLKFVASAKSLRFYFDFDLETVERMDPTGRNIAFGKACPRELCIYIGAKNLLDQRKRSKVIETMAHEIGHIAFGMLYGNNCKPYKQGDELQLKEFNRVLAYCQEDQEKEFIIAHVFYYPPHQWHAELIVRVPHLLVMYKDDEAKLKECQSDFKELFDFYDKKALPDLEEKLAEARNLAKEMQEKHGVPMDFEDVAYFKKLDNQRRRYKIFGFMAIVALIVSSFASWFFWPAIIDPWTAATQQIEHINQELFWAQNDTRIILRNESFQEFNLDVNATGKFVQFKSNCAWMTMIAIYQFLAVSDSLKNNIFVNLEKLENEVTLNKTFKVFDSVVKPQMVINCGDQNETKIANFLGKLETAEFKERIVLITILGSN
jgi:hypothetical protein